MTFPPPEARITITLLKCQKMLFSIRFSAEASDTESPYAPPPGCSFGEWWKYDSRTTQRKEALTPMLSPVDHSDSTFFTQLYAASASTMLWLPPPYTCRSSRPAWRVAGASQVLSCASCAVSKAMCNGVVKVTVLPFTDATSTIWPTGRSVRENQPRDGFPGGDRVADHCTYLGSHSSSISTSMPGAKPFAFATDTEVAPFPPFAVSLTDAPTWGHSGPSHTTAPLKPLLLSRVSWGPLPRRTTPLLITSVLVTANVPADSATTWPAGHASRAARIPPVASSDPLPYVAASIVAHTVFRAGIPPGIPGFHSVRLSGGPA